MKDKWTAILKTVTEDEGFKAFMDERGSPAQFSTPAEWAKIYESDTRLVTDILNAQQPGRRADPARTVSAVHKEPYGAARMTEQTVPRGTGLGIAAELAFL